jgi:hypothetical protein
MFWREIRKSDLTRALAVEPRNLGAEIVGPETALKVWREFFSNRAFRGIAVETEGSQGGARQVAFGAGVMVQPGFITAEIAHPRPHLNSRLIASVTRDPSVLLPWSAVGRANAGDGVDILNLIGSFPSDLDAETVAEVSAVFAESFLEVHKGFRLNRILREMIGQRELQMTASSGIFRTLASFPENESAIRLLTRADAFAVSHSIAINMFRYQPPKLRLREGEQQLLIAALNGDTDAELSKTLRVSLAAIKKRWLTVFQRVADATPQILPSPESADERTRGRQKRHHVLAYVRAHPEELRPYDWRNTST